MQTESLWLLQASVSGVLTQCAAAQPDAKHGVDRRWDWWAVKHTHTHTLVFIVLGQGNDQLYGLW